MSHTINMNLIGSTVLPKMDYFEKSPYFYDRIPNTKSFIYRDGWYVHQVFGLIPTIKGVFCFEFYRVYLN